MMRKILLRFKDKAKHTSLLRVSKKFLFKAFLYFVLTVVAYQFLQPIFQMISQTFMSREDIIDPSVSWIPLAPSFHNLRVAFAVLDMPASLFGSIGFSVLLAFCQVIISALTGYAFARFEFPFKKILFALLLISFVVPIQVLIIPRIMTFQFLQGLSGIQFFGTALPQVLMTLFGQGVFSPILILIFYSFMRMIPKALDEAAMIDGANSLQVFYHIAIRMSASTILVVFLFGVVWNWNETYITNTFLAGNIPLLPNMLSRFDSLFSAGAAQVSGGQGGVNRISEAFQMAGTLITIVPLLVLYLFVQKRFIAGIENSGITGE